MISIVIPTYNEEACIARTILFLREHANGLVDDIIVADGGSSDKTLSEATQAGATIVTGAKGRARQMNAGAAMAKSNVLYFLHADSLPPTRFADDIAQSLNKGYTAGCYRLKFDNEHWFLKANCWFTRFNVDAVRFGDQSLFVTKAIFQRVGGFREDLIVMEDQEIVKRIRKHATFKVMNGCVTTSARKYVDNGVYRMQGIFFLIYFMYQLGYPQEKLVSTYRSFIKQDKV